MDDIEYTHGINKTFVPNPNQKTLYMVFQNEQQRNQAYQAVLKIITDNNLNSECLTSDQDISVYTQQWSDEKISNFDYLMILNSFAQRSFQDLTQYPVMPWILQDYESNVLNPQKPDTFRDLAKPIGTLGDPNRLQ